MKTPVSLLEEYMVGENEDIIYDCTETLDQKSKRSLFTYELKLYGGAYVAHGSGPNKKYAKQLTAQNMLNALAKDRSNVQLLLDRNSKSETSFRNSKLWQILEDSTNYKPRKKIPSGKTPVSILEEYLAVVPNYIFEKIESKPPASTISFHCKLELFDGQYCAEATALTKQEAKQMTARKMVLQLCKEKPRLQRLLIISNCGQDLPSKEDLNEEEDDEINRSCKEIVKVKTNNSPERKDKEFVKETVDNKGLNEGNAEVLKEKSKITCSCSLEKLDMKEQIKSNPTQCDDQKEIRVTKSDGQSNPICTKTPVALLQEYIVQNQEKDLSIDYVFSLDKSNPRWFNCKLSLFNGKYCSEATGLTKKQTKQMTAENMLNQLAQDKPEVKRMLELNKFHEEKDNDVMEDIENNVTVDQKEIISESSSNQENTTIIKTPVSLLQEYLTEFGKVPHYISHELPTKYREPKVFKYEVKVELFGKKFHAEGSGQSKKLAKHETAKNMLHKLSEEQPDLKKLLERNDFYQKMEKITPDISLIKNNPIYQLDTFCRYHNFGSPEYTVIEEMSRIFNMKCQVEYLIVEGTGSKIQLAKHDSAAKMLIRLQEEMRKIQQSECQRKSPSKVERTEVFPTDVGYSDLLTMVEINKGTDAVKKPEENLPTQTCQVSGAHCVEREKTKHSNEEEEENKIIRDVEETYRSIVDSSKSNVEDTVEVAKETNHSSAEPKVKVSEVKVPDTQPSSLKTINPSTSSESHVSVIKPALCQEEAIPEVVRMEVEIDKVKIVHGGKSKSLDEVKTHLSKHQKSLVNLDLNIVNILNQVKLNKGFTQDDNQAFFQYLEEADLDSLRGIVDVLECDKDIIIDFIRFQTVNPDTTDDVVYVTNCKVRVKFEPSTSFKSIATNKDESERKVIVLLLKYLSTMKQ